MKHLIYIIGIALALVSCSGEEMLPGTGSLVITDLAQDEAQTVTVNTRAVDAEFCVEILDETNAVVRSFAPGDAAVGQKIELAPGNYTLHAYTESLSQTPASGELGEAKFEGAATFVVQPEKTSYVSLSVPMVNTAVSLSLPDVFETWFTSHSFTISIDERAVTLTNGQTAYFDLATAPAQAHYTFSATNKDGEEMSQSGTCEVTTGKAYIVAYDMATRSLAF